MKRSIILFLCIIYTASASSLLSNYLERTNFEENNNNVISNPLERKQKHNLLSSIEGYLLTSAVDSLLDKITHKTHKMRTAKKNVPHTLKKLPFHTKNMFGRPGFKRKHSFKFSNPKRLKVRKPNKRFKARKPVEPLKVRKPVEPLKVRKPNKRFKARKPVEPLKVRKPVEPLKVRKPVEPLKVNKLSKLSKPIEPLKVNKPMVSLKSSHKSPEVHDRK